MGGYSSASHHRGDFLVEARPVESDGEGGLRIGPLVATFAEGVWLPSVSDNDVWAAAMIAAVEKSECYHCREPHFVAPPRHAAMGNEG